MESSQARIDFLEQSILNLREELASQAALAEKEMLDFEQTLRKMMEEHQNLETVLHTMERQLSDAIQESELRRQELRDRDFELAQLKASIADRDRDIESLNRRLKASPAQPVAVAVHAQQTTPAAQVQPIRENSISVSQLLLVCLVALVGTLVAVGLSRQSFMQPTAPNSIETPRS